MLNFIQGSLLDANDKYIAHQCNCISKKAAYLAKDLFEKFSYADGYTGRATPNKLGTIRVMGNGEDQRYVINMFGQYTPGKPAKFSDAMDGVKAREHAFHQCLLRIYHMPDLESIGFPYRIGCGAAGGNWNNYLGTLEIFSRYLPGIVDVNIYCRTKKEREQAEAEYAALLPKMMAIDLEIYRK